VCPGDKHTVDTLENTRRTPSEPTDRKQGCGQGHVASKLSISATRGLFFSGGQPRVLMSKANRKSSHPPTPRKKWWNQG